MTELTQDQRRGLMRDGWCTPTQMATIAADTIRLVERIAEQHDLLVDARDLLLGALSSGGIANADLPWAAVTVEAIEQLIFGKAEQ